MCHSVRFSTSKNFAPLSCFVTKICKKNFFQLLHKIWHQLFQFLKKRFYFFLQTWSTFEWKFSWDNFLSFLVRFVAQKVNFFIYLDWNIEQR
jgi:hypothetical protein